MWLTNTGQFGLAQTGQYHRIFHLGGQYTTIIINLLVNN
jgi:hypothetical protein